MINVFNFVLVAGELPGHLQSTSEVPLSKGAKPPNAQTGPCDELALVPGFTRLQLG